MPELQHDGEGVAPARDRLMAAALSLLFERGYHGATSRRIAQEAGVNEVTLFRLFSTKDDLLAAAVLNRGETDRAEVPAATGDLEADLRNVATVVSSFLFTERQPLVRILTEVARMPEKQRVLVRESMEATQEKFLALFRHYQDLGQLCDDDIRHMWIVFMGPILMTVQYSSFREQKMPFDPVQHVRLFLLGCGRKHNN